jgi:predicted dienelactone hydrolase
MLRMPFRALILLVASAVLLVVFDPRVALAIDPTGADQPGPFQAATLSTRFQNANGTYTATVRYPSSDAAAPYPAVVYSPGLGSQKEFNAEVGAHLATHGYVVLTFTAPDRNAIQQKIDGLASGLDFLARAGADPTSPLFGLVDPTRRVVMGHSQGGEAALQLAAVDRNLAAVIAQAPSIGIFAPRPIDTITAPTLLQAATEDKLVPFANAVNAYAMQLRAPRQLVVIEGGNHVGFNDVGSPAGIAVLFGIDNPARISNADQRLLARRYETAWLEFHVKGRDTFRTLIDGPRVQLDVQLGLLRDARTDL